MWCTSGLEVITNMIRFMTNMWVTNDWRHIASNSALTKSAFKGIGHIYRYLVQDVIHPLCYPRNSIDGKSLVTMHLLLDNNINLEVSNQLTAFGDAELAWCLSTQCTYVCVVIVILNIAVYVNIVKASVMQHTTDSEITTHYLAVQFLKPIYQQFEIRGLLLMNPLDNKWKKGNYLCSTLK
jgi:hypothetical protein